jgi:hypothetical protein
MARKSFPVEVQTAHRQHSVPFTQIFPFQQRVFEPQPKTVAHMIQQLPPSLKRLVDQVEVLPFEEEIARCLQHQQQIFMASHVGAIPGRTSYGWII